MKKKTVYSFIALGFMVLIGYSIVQPVHFHYAKAIFQYCFDSKKYSIEGLDVKVIYPWYLASMDKDIISLTKPSKKDYFGLVNFLECNDAFLLNIKHAPALKNHKSDTLKATNVTLIGYIHKVNTQLYAKWNVAGKNTCIEVVNVWEEEFGDIRELLNAIEK